MAQAFFGFTDDALTPDNWEALYDAAAAKMAGPTGPQQVLASSKLEAVFLTNDFDDPLDGLRHARVRPLPADRRSGVSSGASRAFASGWKRPPATSVHDAASLRTAIGKLFEHFAAHGARACAISLPPDFTPRAVDVGERAAAAVDTALDRLLQARRAGGRARAATRRQLRVLDAGRVLRRVQAAVRPDDRRQPRRLSAAASIRARTCTTAACR